MQFSKRFLNFVILINLLKLLNNYPFRKVSIEKLQRRKLRKLLKFAYENFDFYKERMDRVGFDPYVFSNVSDLNKLPLLSKEEYRAFIESTVNINPEKYKASYMDKTSGSTGIPLKITRSWVERGKMLARFLRPLFINGLSIFDLTMGIINPDRLSKKDSIMQRLGIFRRLAIDNTLPNEYIVNLIQKHKPAVIYANQSNLILLALFIKKKKLKISHPKFYYSVGETLDTNTRELLKSVFGPNLLNHYGSVEMGTLGFETLHKSTGMQFTHDTHLLEVLDHTNHSNQGKVVITDFDIYSFPMIRYNVGDEIKIKIDANNMPEIVNIIGRSDDLIILPNGEKRSFNIFTSIFLKFEEIIQFKIIQVRTDTMNIIMNVNNMDRIEILKETISKSIEEKLGHEFTFSFKIVPYIEPERNGKIAKFINLVNSPTQI